MATICPKCGSDRICISIGEKSRICLDCKHVLIENETCPKCGGEHVKRHPGYDPVPGCHDRLCHDCQHTWEAAAVQPSQTFPFYMLYSPQGGHGPQKIHFDMDKAVAEAERICAKGKKDTVVYLLEGIAMVKQARPPLVWEKAKKGDPIA